MYIVCTNKWCLGQQNLCIHMSCLSRCPYFTVSPKKLKVVPLYMMYSTYVMQALFFASLTGEIMYMYMMI